MLKAELRCWPARRLPGTLLKQPDIYIYIYIYGTSNSGLRLRKNSSKHFSQFRQTPLKKFASFKSTGFKGHQTISLPGEPKCLRLVLTTHDRSQYLIFQH